MSRAGKRQADWLVVRYGGKWEEWQLILSQNCWMSCTGRSYITLLTL